MANRQIDGWWYADFWFKHSDGKRKRYRVRAQENKADSAKQAENEKRAELVSGGGTLPAPKVPTLGAYAPAFLTAGMNRNKATAYRDKESILRLYWLPFLGAKRLDEITADDVEAVIALRLKEGYARKTINNHLIVFNALHKRAFDTCVVLNRLRVPLLKGVKSTKDSAFRFLQFEEVPRLIKAAVELTAQETWLLPMVVTAVKTGLRIGELQALEWTDVDLKAGRLVVRRRYHKHTYDSPKSGKDREIPLADSVIDVLTSYRHLRGPKVFCNEDGSVIPWGKANWWLRRAAAKAGLQGVSGWHDMRHTFASHLAMKGVPMRTIQELMGHATIEMTLRYAKLAPNVVRDAVRVLDAPEVQEEEAARDDAP